MHPVTNILHWSHHMHEGMDYLWHQTLEHLHSPHFWIGVGITLLVIGLISLLLIAVLYGSIEFSYGRYPYMPYGL